MEHSLRFLVLATGSKGNCAYIATPHAQILVDCGIPLRDVAAGLAAHGIDMRQIDALFITHTHSDHIRTVPALLRRQPLRVFCPQGHIGELRGLSRLATDADPLDGPLFSTEQIQYTAVEPNHGFHYRDLDVLPVPVSHDCSPTVMYKFHCGTATVGLLTDLGATNSAQAALFADCDALLLESNHCVDMLHRGRYPEHLKRRIRGERGHLSNDESAQFAVGLATLPRHLLLGHLSDDNNTPNAASAAFSRVEYGGSIPHTVISQRTVGPLLEL